ncbi:MAG: tetratricopeptide repeat protein [Candidatus Wallbacteria bacterium]
MSDKITFIKNIFGLIKSNPRLLNVINSENIVSGLEEITRNDSEDISLKYDLCDFLINSGSYEKAREILNYITDSGSGEYMAHFLIAKSRYIEGNLKEAQFPIMKCLEIYPNFDEGRFLLGKIFLKARQYEKSHKLFEYYQSLPEYKERAEIYVAKSLYYSASFEAAAAYCERILKDKSSTHAYIAMLYAYQLYNNNYNDKAFDVICSRLLRKDIKYKERFLLNCMNVFLLSSCAANNYFEDFISEAGGILENECALNFSNKDDELELYKNFAETAYFIKSKKYELMEKSGEKVLACSKNYSLEDYTVFEYEEFNNIFKLAKNKNSQAEELKNKGLMHINANNYNAALNYFEMAAEILPRDTDVLTKLGENYLLINQHDKAIAAYEKIKQIVPDYPEPYRRIAEIYSGTGNYEKFISECRKILNLEPEDYFSRYYIGEYLFNNASYKESEEFLRYLLTKLEEKLKSLKNNSWPEQLKDIYEKTSYILAQIAFKEGHKENTILYLNNVININPENEKAFELLNKLKQNRQDREIMVLLREAEERESEKQYTQANQILENIIELNPHFIEAHYRIAKNSIRQKEFDRAIFEFERIFDYEYESFDRLSEIYLLMALLAYEVGKIEKCRESLGNLSKFLNNDSTNLMHLYLYRASFFIYGEAADFNKFINEIIESRIGGNDDFKTNFSIGYAVFGTPKWIFKDENIFVTALDAAETAYNQDENDIYAAYAYAVALEKSGRVEDAYEHYSQIANIDINNDGRYDHTRNKYQLINGKLKLTDDGLKFALMENLNILNLIHDCAVKVAHSMEKNGINDEALNLYEKAALMVPENPQNIMKSIDIFIAGVLNDKAKISKISGYIKNLKKEIEAQPKRVDLKFRLGYTYFKLPEELSIIGSTVENIIVELKTCIGQAPDYLPAYSALRRVYDKMGASDKKMYAVAVDTLKKAFEFIDEKNPYLNVEMADCFYNSYGHDLKSEAAEYYQKAILYKADMVEAHFKLGSIYRFKKDFEKAILHFGIAYDIDPNGIYSQECLKSLAALKKRELI